MVGINIKIYDSMRNSLRASARNSNITRYSFFERGVEAIKTNVLVALKKILTLALA
jgi:hypothetical protein